MTEKQRDLLSNYFNEGNGCDVWYIKNLNHNEFLVYEDSNYNRFLEYLKEINVTWEDFKEEYEVDDWDYWENYFICDKCGEVLYMNEYGINDGYVKEDTYNLVCNECADWDNIIDDLTNEPMKCINTNYEEIYDILKKHKFHEHDTYVFLSFETPTTPEDIVKEFKDKYDYIWLLTRAEMFRTEAILFLRNK